MGSYTSPMGSYTGIMGSSTSMISRKSREARLFAQLLDGLYTVWLFPLSDLKTIGIPQTIFGTIGGIPQANLTHGDRTAGQVLQRAPLVAFWVWIILCPFTIDNQRRPQGIQEDKINRPWRPLPTKRVTPDQALILQLTLHFLALLYSAWVGCVYYWAAGILLGWLYNGVGLGDRSCLGKNAVNAMGYVTFAMGAVSVATCGSDFTAKGLQWFAIQAGVIFTTVQIQDLEDVEGDRARGRQTGPLVLGDRLCRWSIAVLVLTWTITASSFWGAARLYTLCCMAGAGVIAWRVLNKTEISQDKVTFRLWNAWIVSLYVLPLAS